MTTDKEILARLVKIASNQQKILVKLAQGVDLNDLTVQAGKFINGAIGTWLTNNGINARYKYHFETSDTAPGTFDLRVVFSSPTPNVPIVSPFPDLEGKFKSDFAVILAGFAPLKNQAVNISVETE